MNDHNHPQPPERTDSAPPAFGASKISSATKTRVDPVCGMSVDPATATHHLEHAGESHYFCSARCLEKFSADPDKYLHPETNQNTSKVLEGAIYTCPMHPQIRQIGPGTCPICGMALEPETPSLEEEENPELRDFSRRFWWTLPLSLVVLILAMFGHYLPWLSTETRTWAELVLSAPVVLWAGWPFFVRWLASIRNLSPNMWTLIGTGIIAAFGYSLVATLVPGLFPASFEEHGRIGVYFEAAAVIVSWTLGVSYLNSRLVARLPLRSRPCSTWHQRPLGDSTRQAKKRTFRSIKSRQVIGCACVLAKKCLWTEPFWKGSAASTNRC